MVLVGVSEGSVVNEVILSAPPMIWLGKLSYPLYLWHWPFLSFWAVMVEPKAVEHSFYVGCVLQFLAFLCALFTLYFVEKPLRFSSNKSGTAGVLLLTSLVLLGAGVMGTQRVIEPYCLQDPIVRGIMENRAFEGWNRSKNFQQYFVSGYEVDDMHPLLRSRGHSSKRVLFVGDSNCIQFLPRIDENLSLFPNRSYSVSFFSYPAICPVLGFDERAGYVRHFMESAINSIAEDPEVFRVVLCAAWYNHFFWGGWGVRKNGIDVMNMTSRVNLFSLSLVLFVLIVCLTERVGEKAVDARSGGHGEEDLGDEERGGGGVVHPSGRGSGPPVHDHQTRPHGRPSHSSGPSLADPSFSDAAARGDEEHASGSWRESDRSDRVYL